MLRFCDALIALLFIVFPLFSPVDPETDVAPVIDYVDDNPLLARATRQAPPLDHQISPILLSTVCIRVG